MNPFYNHTSGVPIAQSRGVSSSVRTELDLVGAGFDTANTAIDLKAPSASPALTGTPTAPTAAPLTSTTQVATTEFATLAVAVETARAIAAEALKAPLASPTFAGTVTLPATGAGATEAVRKDYADGLAFATALPAQTGNAGKFVTTDGTTASWADTVTLTGTQTLTNKTIALGSNTVSGTFAQFNAACTDADFALAFPSGTAMLFAQTAAPTGWTKSTTHDNKALRVVSGTAGSGGSTAFTTVFASRTPAGSVTVDGTTLTESQMPAHTHATSAYNGNSTGSFDNAGGVSAVTSLSSASITSSSTGGGGSHTHTGSFTGTAMDFAVQYVDVIIATKD